MKLIKKFILCLPIKNIFIILMMVFTLIPTLICLTVSDIYTKKTIKSYSTQYLKTVNEAVTSNLSDMIYQINLHSVTITSLPEITLTIVSDKPYEKKRELLDKTLSNFLDHNALVDGLLITAKNGESYLCFPEGAGYVFDDADFFNLLQKPQPSIYEECVLVNGKYYIVFGKKFFNFNTGEDIGSLIFFIDEEQILSTYNNSAADNNTFYLECNGHIISHSDKSALNAKLLIPDSLKNQNRDGFNYIYEHKLDLPLANSDLKTVFILSTENENKLIDKIRNRTYAASLLIMLISVASAVILAKSLTNSLAEFKKSMEEFADNPDTEVSLDTSNEISALSVSFDKMIRQIKNLVRMNNIEKEKQKQAELLAMQSQISPHFIFNALDIAHCMAKLRGQTDIEEILYALASFFRLGLYNASKIISIHDELEHVKSFLTIETLRFPHLFTVKYDIDEKILKYKMTGVILQPIVENSIKHGFRDIDYTGELKIFGGFEDENTIIFKVSDNGQGMEAPPDLSQNYEQKGYGLRNVNERLTIVYGSRCGLEFETAPKKGTTVTFRIIISD